MIVPNTGRVLIRLIKKEQESGVIVPGQLKAGENLFLGEIIHPGTTPFKKGQTVWYSEYSAAALYDIERLDLGEAMKEKNIYFVVAEDDIMAYEADKEVTKDVPKA